MLLAQGSKRGQQKHLAPAWQAFTFNPSQGSSIGWHEKADGLQEKVEDPSSASSRYWPQQVL